MESIVTVFNPQVGNTGWTGMRAYHDQALIDEFQRRGIDVSAIYERLRVGDETSEIGKTITFAHPIRYDLPNSKLVVTN